MRRLLKVFGYALAGFILICVSAFTISCVNTETSAARAARLNADLREKVPPGSSVEQLQEWLIANGFDRYPDLDRWAKEPPHKITIVGIDDPAWLSSAEFLIELRFDEHGRVLSTRITSQIVSL